LSRSTHAASSARLTSVLLARFEYAKLLRCGGLQRPECGTGR
jgi:hypothetical protein